MNPGNGNMECQISQLGINKISSLNQFSPDGKSLLSGMGQTVLIWKQKPNEDVQYEEKLSNLKDIVVEEWPGYKPQNTKSKKAKNSKSKKLAD